MSLLDMHQSCRTGYLATFPERTNLLRANLPRLLCIFSKLSVCLNEYTDIPEFLKGDERITAFLPERDYKDVGKFIGLGDGSDKFLLDDDIVYPVNYADTLISYAGQFSGPVVLGVHGIVYRHSYSGGRSGRRSYRYYSGLSRFVDVDVLGTGTVLLSGFTPPPMEFMEGSAGFVDVRFGRYCAQRGVPRICVPRPSCWLTACEHDGSKLFADVTSKENPAILEEVKEIVERRGASTVQGRMVRMPMLDRIRIAASFPRGFAYRSRRTVYKISQRFR